MLKKIAIVIVVAIIAVLGFAATKPDSFRVERSATIKAPPEKIFAYINDFHRWNQWSPYEKLDPAMTRTLSGAESGKGAIYEWSGNNQAGAGRMEITDSTPASKITIKLDFSKPMEGHNTAEFTFTPQGDSTQVSWAMSGPMPYIAKVMSIFFNMDQMIGKDFETGLGNLKALSEK